MCVCVGGMVGNKMDSIRVGRWIDVSMESGIKGCSCSGGGSGGGWDCSC